VYVATSADGSFAGGEGSVDWLDRPRTGGDYGMGAFFRSIDTILWGRKTYEPALSRFGGKGVGVGAGIRNYVFSHRPPKRSVPKGGGVVHEPVGTFAERRRGQAGKAVWVTGG